MKCSDTRELQAWLIVGGLIFGGCTICYFWLDQALAIWIHENVREAVRKPFTAWDLSRLFAPGLLICLAIVLLSLKWSPSVFRIGIACLVSYALAEQLKDPLKWIFGRPYPETYLNPAYHNYKFRWFDGYGPFTAFPSGHMAATVAVISVLWILDPPRRLWYWLTALGVAVGLVASDLHFLGDVVAGAFVGALVGRLTVSVMLIPHSRSGT